MPVTTITLAGIPVIEPATPGIGINTFTMGTGATRPGVGTFLMLRKDYDLHSTDDTWKLSMFCPDGGDRIEFDVVPCGCMPFEAAQADKPSVGSPDDIVRVVVRDKRVYQLAGGLTRKQYNVYAGGTAVADTQTGGADWAWAALMADAGLPALPTAPGWAPRGVLFDAVPKRQAVDWVAGHLWLVVAYDWATDTLAYADPGTYSPANDKLLKRRALDTFIAGQRGDVAARRVPQSFDVVFSAAGDLWGTKRHYIKTVTTGNSSPDSLAHVPLHVGGWAPFPDGDAPTNSADLDAVAADIAARATKMLSAPWAEWTFPGFWAFKPDGAIRQVVWCGNGDDAYTRVHINCQRDYSPFEGMENAFNAPGNTLVQSAGGVGYDSGTGSRYVTAGGGNVRVRIDSDGGYAGGYYKGFRVGAPAAALDPTVDLVAAVLGADGAEVIVADAQELGAAAGSHWITAAGNTAQRYFDGVVIGTSTTGKTVVLVNSIWVKKCG